MQLISVVIADDDQLVLQDLKYLVDWKYLGFQIVAIASNGEQAFAYIKKYRPQVLITDIRMPRLNGLELIKAVKETVPNTKIIIISSYDDFDYAKKAIQFGVFDYILKNEITSASFTEKLISLSQNVLESSFMNNIVIQQTLTLYFSETSPATIKHTDYSSIRMLENERYYFIIISSPCAFIKDMQQIHESNAQSVDYLMSQIRQLERRRYQIPLFFSHETFVIIGIRIESAKSGHRILLDSLSRSIYTSINSRSPQPCVMFYYRKRVSITKYRDIYQDCLPLLRFYSVFTPDYPMDLEKLQKKNYIQTAQQFPMHKLVSCSNYLEDNIIQMKNHLTLCYQNLDLASIRYFYVNFCTQMEIVSNGQMQFSSANYFNSLEILLKWIFNTYEDCLQFAENNTGIQYSFAVDSAISFMEQNYPDFKLTAKIISDHVGLSSGRLGVLFKQETKRTINECLTNIRIKNAVHLLTHTNLKIYEIAERCGYKSSQYFSQIFFQKTGKRPIDYRKLPVTQKEEYDDE